MFGNQKAKSIRDAAKITLDIVERKCRNVGLTIDREIKDDTTFPFDTGGLKQSQSVDISIGDKKIIVTWYNTKEYAPYIHQGTGIYAKDGQGRKTPWLVKTRYKGKLVTFRTVGMKAQRFLEKHTTDNLERINQLMRGG